MSKTCHFLLPAGGALTISQYWHVDVFRARLISCMWNLGQIGLCKVKLQQLPVWWWNMQLWRHDTMFRKKTKKIKKTSTFGFEKDTISLGLFDLSTHPKQTSLILMPRRRTSAFVLVVIISTTRGRHPTTNVNILMTCLHRTYMSVFLADI